MVANWLILSLFLTAEGPVDAIAPPGVAATEAALMKWVDGTVEAGDAGTLREAAAKQWNESLGDGSPAECHGAVLNVAFLLSEDVRAMVAAAEEDDWATIEATLPKMASAPIVDANMRLFLGRTLVTIGASEDAEPILNDADETLCADPAALVFLTAVCQHARLDKEAGIATIDRLLDPGSVVPERYRALARLMRQDLEDLEDNDLAKTAREMRQLQQQLQRGKSGKKTQERERQILEKLDKMIEKMEQKQKQAQGQGGAPGGNQQGNPAEESRIAGESGPGEVDRKAVGKSSGWGNLPEKSRTEARNLINRQFPSHYRRAVEEYLKKLADRPAP